MTCMRKVGTPELEAADKTSVPHNLCPLVLPCIRCSLQSPAAGHAQEDAQTRGTSRLPASKVPVCITCCYSSQQASSHMHSSPYHCGGEKKAGRWQLLLRESRI